MVSSSTKSTADINNKEHEEAADAKRVLIVDEDGNADTPVRKDLEGGGKISVGTTAVEVTFTGTTNSILITADTSNSGILYVGKSNVTNTEIGGNAFDFLLAGQSIIIDYDDVDNAIFVVASVSSQNFWSGAVL